jgi:hypothetical protein
MIEAQTILSLKLARATPNEISFLNSFKYDIIKIFPSTEINEKIKY